MVAPSHHSPVSICARCSRSSSPIHRLPRAIKNPGAPVPPSPVTVAGVLHSPEGQMHLRPDRRRIHIRDPASRSRIALKARFTFRNRAQSITRIQCRWQRDCLVEVVAFEHTDDRPKYLFPGNAHLRTYTSKPLWGQRKIPGLAPPGDSHLSATGHPPFARSRCNAQRSPPAAG